MVNDSNDAFSRTDVHFDVRIIIIIIGKFQVKIIQEPNRQCVWTFSHAN